VVVLRNGLLVSDLAPSEATEQRIIRDMVGRDLLPEGELAAPADRATFAFEAAGLKPRTRAARSDAAARRSRCVAGLMDQGAAVSCTS